MIKTSIKNFVGHFFDFKLSNILGVADDVILFAKPEESIQSRALYASKEKSSQKIFCS